MKTRIEFTVEERKTLKDKFKIATEFVSENVGTKKSSIQLKKEHGIHLNIRDKNGNRAMVTLYKSLLTKSITEAQETCAPVVNKINKSILELINDNKY